MTVSDLARWLDRPFSTVRVWTTVGREPRGPAGRRADLLLAELEKKIRKGLVIPADLNDRERINYVEGLRDDCRKKLFGAHLTR